jgi:hypothetical protein
VKVSHRVEVRDAYGAVSETTVRVKYHRLRVHPPTGKQKHYPPLMLTVVQAQEACAPPGREKIARLGGYLDRAKDPPPGNTVMWRGFARLTDIELGFILGARLVGN